jgi:hypothetical protein
MLSATRKCLVFYVLPDICKVAMPSKQRISQRIPYFPYALLFPPIRIFICYCKYKRQWYSYTYQLSWKLTFDYKKKFGVKIFEMSAIHATIMPERDEQHTANTAGFSVYFDEQSVSRLQASQHECENIWCKPDFSIISQTPQYCTNYHHQYHRKKTMPIPT